MIACFLVVLTSKVCECLGHLGAVHQEVALHVDHLQADVIVAEDDVLNKRLGQTMLGLRRLDRRTAGAREEVC